MNVKKKNVRNLACAYAHKIDGLLHERDEMIMKRKTNNIFLKKMNKKLVPKMRPVRMKCRFPHIAKLSTSDFLDLCDGGPSEFAWNKMILDEKGLVKIVLCKRCMHVMCSNTLICE